MKLKRILNGIAALLTVGMFYTFAFCMVQDIHEQDIAADYDQTDKNDQSESEGVQEASDYIGGEMPMETSAVSGEAAVPTLSSRSPSRIIIPDAVPDSDTLISSAPMLPAPEGLDEITDENYRENSDIDDLSISDEEMDDYFPEEDDVDEYGETAAAKTKGESKSDRQSEKEALSSVNSGNVTADDINSGMADDNDDADIAVYAAAAQPDAPAANYSWGEVVEMSDTAALSASDTDSGEIFTAKVHGEVQEFDAYELVCMIVANEVSPSFSREAIKAQAVAAYSYVKYHNNKGVPATVLVKEEIPDTIRDCVSEVWGQCCYYNGSVAQTVYTASTSGYTASAVNVWGSSDVPYLQSKECPFDADYDPNYGVKVTYTVDEMRSKLERYLGDSLSDDPANWLVVTDYEDGNYVKSILIDGHYQITGRQMRESVLSYSLKSAAFTVSYDDGVFTFTTYGYGHGVGMSQNGANILAKQGYSYLDILSFYFPGTYVQ